MTESKAASAERVLRVGVVGVGVMGSNHARVLAEMPGIQLVGIADPLRPSVPDAVNQCRSAGIKVVMITGDYPATAKAIARHAGLESEDVMTGDELERMGDAELAVRLRSATVFARIMPEQKLRIVNAFKANGEIVAMTRRQKAVRPCPSSNRCRTP